MIECITPEDDRPPVVHSNAAVPFDTYMPKSFYHAATELQRSITFVLDKPMRVRALRIELAGIGVKVEARYLATMLYEMRALGLVKCTGGDQGHGYLWQRDEVTK